MKKLYKCWIYAIFIQNLPSLCELFKEYDKIIMSDWNKDRIISSHNF